MPPSPLIITFTVEFQLIKDSHKTSGTEVRERPQEHHSVVPPKQLLMLVVKSSICHCGASGPSTDLCQCSQCQCVLSMPGIP